MFLHEVVILQWINQLCHILYVLGHYMYLDSDFDDSEGKAAISSKVFNMPPADGSCMVSIW